MTPALVSDEMCMRRASRDAAVIKFDCRRVTPIDGRRGVSARDAAAAAAAESTDWAGGTNDEK